MSNTDRARPGRSRTLLAGVMIAAAGLALAGCANSTPQASPSSGSGESLETALESMEPRTLVYSINLPDTSSVGLAVKAFKTYVEEKTDGKITIDDQYNSAVMPAEEALAGVQSGLADIALTSTTYYQEELPVSNLLQNLGADSDPSFPAGWLQALAAGTEFFSTDEAVAEEWASHDAKVLYATSPSRYSLMCTSGIQSLEDAKGRQTRASGSIWSGEVEAMGMAPVALPIAEIYEGLQRGVVDCVSSTPDTMASLSVPEVAKHFIPVQMSTQVTGVVFMNLDVWNDLPTPVQEVIQEGALEGMRAYTEFVADAVAGFVELLGDDVTVHDPAELDKAVIARQEAVVDDFLAETSVPDADGIVQRYRDTLEDWLTVVTDDLGIAPGARDIDSTIEGYEEGGSLDLDPFFSELNERL